MPRASLALILVLALLAACGENEPAPPPAPAPEKPAVQRVSEAPPEPKAAPPAIDLKPFDEDGALVALMKYRIAHEGDESQQALARFRPVTAGSLLDTPADLLPDDQRPGDADQAQALARLIEQQVPDDIRDAVRAAGKAGVLVVESCGADTASALGIPNDYDEGSAPQYLDQARFDLAMESEKQKPIPLPGDFRDLESERESVADLNRQLFARHKSGAAKEILLVVDLSFDCASGGSQVTLVTEPPFESLRILPAFYFVLCGQRVEDAWAQEQCRWWENVEQPLTMDQGTYYYVAKWPDGLEKRGRFVIDDLVAEAIGEGQDALTLDIR